MDSGAAPADEGEGPQPAEFLVLRSTRDELVSLAPNLADI